MYQALYRKWRPKTFSDVVGQEHVTATLKRQVAEGRLSHAYLFTGTRGTGKTTCAKILAKAVNCENPQNGDPCNACPSCLGIESGAFLDVMELDAASNNGVDHVRALRDEAIYSPAQVKKRVYIVDEVHMLSIAAFNALLKILEEPPEHLMFVLATTELNKVPATILSRCQRFAFRRIPPRAIEERLSYVAKEEGLDLRPDGAELLSRLSDGALRDALSLLDQCAAAGGSIDASHVLDTLGLAGNVQTAQLMEFVLRRDAKAALLLLHQLYSGGKDVSSVLNELSSLSRDLLISITAPEGGASLLGGGYDEKTLSRLRALASGPRLIHLCACLQEASSSMQFSVNRRTDAELCLLRLCDEGLSGDLSALNARISRLEELLAAGAAHAASVGSYTVLETSETAPISESIPALKPESAPLNGSSGSAASGDTAPERETATLSDAPSPSFDESADPQPAAASSHEDHLPAADATASAQSGEPLRDDDIYSRLMENYKNRLSSDTRAFIGFTSGSLSGELLTVYCPLEIYKNRLDHPPVIEALSEVTAQAVGHPVTVRFEVREAEGKPHDKMQDLLRIGNSFDRFTMK